MLPTYDTGGYTAGSAATILLGIFRFLQGLAVGGEYGAACVYVSECAGVAHRGLLTAVVQARPRAAGAAVGGSLGGRGAAAQATPR